MKSLTIINSALLIGLASCSVPERGSAERFAASGELIALSGADAGASNACFTCHGIDGLGDGAGVPRLAGLNAGYLEAQLRAYADGRRYHPQMEWIASQLSPAERRVVSAYYDALPYEPNPTTQPPVPALYAAGDPARGLPSCASCHGLAGQGVGAGNPPLGGQPAAYLAAQLRAWRDSKRRSDPGNIMLDISQRLTPAEVTALSAYAAALPGRPHGREFPAAFP
ncbi:MAG: c-type cytochrome [Pseudomonadota bacterium]|nr:c-type cytochrome [Pseudomonadota bacterium]